MTATAFFLVVVAVGFAYTLSITVFLALQNRKAGWRVICSVAAGHDKRGP